MDPPKSWMGGAVVYIYENKGDARECNNYRPICLAQIAYKIWAKIVTNRLACILPLATKITQFGYKKRTSTIDALRKIQDFLDTKSKEGLLVLLDLSKAFDTINRKLLWTALYRKGLPVQLIQTLRKGHENTKLRVKNCGNLGDHIKNNVGVFQGSPLSALLFIIYLDDMMDDFEALNDLCDLKARIMNLMHDNDKTTRENFEILKTKNEDVNRSKDEGVVPPHHLPRSPDEKNSDGHQKRRNNDRYHLEDPGGEAAWALAPQCRMQPKPRDPPGETGNDGVPTHRREQRTPTDNETADPRHPRGTTPSPNTGFGPSLGGG